MPEHLVMMFRLKPAEMWENTPLLRQVYTKPAGQARYATGEMARAEVRAADAVSLRNPVSVADSLPAAVCDVGHLSCGGCGHSHVEKSQPRSVIAPV
jgi:hypothetical protein